mgnify:CR=1 FL=1
MIQCRLRELIGMKARLERRRITYETIQSESGVNNNTIVKLANDRAAMVGMSAIDRRAGFECIVSEHQIPSPKRFVTGVDTF